MFYRCVIRKKQLNYLFFTSNNNYDLWNDGNCELLLLSFYVFSNTESKLFGLTIDFMCVNINFFCSIEKNWRLNTKAWYWINYVPLRNHRLLRNIIYTVISYNCINYIFQCKIGIIKIDKVNVIPLMIFLSFCPLPKYTNT